MRLIGTTLVGVTVDDTIEMSEIDRLSHVLAQLNSSTIKAPKRTEEKDCIPETLIRSDSFLTQQVFNMPRCESEFMRYVRHLERKDLGLDQSMIPLGKWVPIILMLFDL